MNILVLNSFGRNGLAAIHAMSSWHNVYGGGDFCTPLRRKLCKRFKTKRLKGLFNITSPNRDPEQFKEDVISAVIEGKIDVILPTGSGETDYLSYYKNEISNRCNAIVIAEDYEKQIITTDKWHTYNLGKRAGVPVPETILINEIKHLARQIRESELRFPLVLKPRIATAAEGVHFFNSEEELSNFIESNEQNLNPQKDTWIVQEFHRGELHDITSCSWKGEVHAMLSQKRLMTWYDFGGGGIINITTDEAQIKTYATAIIKKLEWRGILEFDFILDDERRYWLIECNPKIWGTTQLTVDAGLNMPKMMVDLWLNNGGERPSSSYEIDVVYKWIFPYCMASWLNKPFNLKTLTNRIKKTFKQYQAKKSITNIQAQYLMHHLGCMVMRIPM